MQESRRPRWREGFGRGCEGSGWAGVRGLGGEHAGGGNSQCHDLEASACLQCLQKSKEASEQEVEGAGRESEATGQRVNRVRAQAVA